MQPITMKPQLKFLILIIQFMIVYLINDIRILAVLIILNVICYRLFKLSLRLLFKLMRYGIFLSIFALSFNLLITNNLNLALISAANLLFRFILILIASLIYRNWTTNKEIAFVISKIMKGFGISQNKTYTMILVILNQINDFQQMAMQLYRYSRFHNPVTSWNGRVKQIIDLIPVFITNVIKQNENFTISLLNKNYRTTNKQVNVYFPVKYQFKPLLITIIYFCSELIMIGIMKG